MELVTLQTCTGTSRDTLKPFLESEAKSAPKSVARGIPGLPKHLLPFPVEYSFTIPVASLEIASKRLNGVFNSLHMQWQYRPSLATGIGFANENIWSRAARRRQMNREATDAGERRGNEQDEKGEDDDDEEEEEENAKPPRLGCKIRLSPSHVEKDGVQILIRWIMGNDSVLFESFCGMLRNQMMRPLS